MNADDLAIQAITLPDHELHRLVVRLVEEEDQRNSSLPGMFTSRIDDRDPAHWHSLEKLKSVVSTEDDA